MSILLYSNNERLNIQSEVNEIDIKKIVNFVDLKI